jgi:8-oxo-dGTP pyrophosphatase MutT (NUDIX family)
MNQTPLRQLVDLLPLYSEEDDLREIVTEAELLEQLSASFGHPAAQATLAVVRRLFEALCLLDLRVLQQNDWAFSSFPAFLAAQSLLQTLSTPDQRLCETDYWQTPPEIGNLAGEEQRLLLHELEARRVRFHPSNAAEPVRYVYVAWGLIRIGGLFLLHHREDQTRPHVKNYVFPGGRFKPSDLPLKQQTPSILRRLHCSQSVTALEALPSTLERELFEELGIRSGKHFSATPRQTLAPYRRVEGAGNKHAYTEYVLALYDVSLTAEGETRLLETVAAKDDKLSWFTCEDLANPLGRPDGKMAFIDALQQQFGARLRPFLAATPESSRPSYRFSLKADTVELPAQNDAPFLVGDTGKEKKKLICLTPDTHNLLLIAAAHAKGMRLEADPAHLALYPGGWLKLNSAQTQGVMQELLATLDSERLPLIQVVTGNFARISVASDILFFNELFFAYRIRQEESPKGELTLTFSMPESPWTARLESSITLALVANMIRSIEKIAAGNVGLGDLEKDGYSDETLKKNFKEMLDEKTQPLGLRKLIRMVGKRYHLGAKRHSE